MVLCRRARASVPGGNRKGNTFATLLLATYSLSGTSYEDGDGGIDDGGKGRVQKLSVKFSATDRPLRGVPPPLRNRRKFGPKTVF